MKGQQNLSDKLEDYCKQLKIDSSYYYQGNTIFSHHQDLLRDNKWNIL